jgi:hypothetical protein
VELSLLAEIRRPATVELRANAHGAQNRKERFDRGRGGAPSGREVRTPAMALDAKPWHYLAVATAALSRRTANKATIAAPTISVRDPAANGASETVPF